MFFDPSLSSSGQLSCASCHSPHAAYGPPNELAIQFGGADMKRSAFRAVPSLRYLEHTPNFSIGPNPEMADNDPVPLDTAAPPAPAMPADNVKVASVAKADPNSAARAAAEANVPQGGLDRDGRADTFQIQALGPLLDPNEMDNHSAAEVLERLEQAAYADDLKKLFGANIFSQAELALDEAMFALARFQTEDPSFHPYDSKYDAYLAGKAELSAAEQRGLKLFEDPLKGNCASCHLDRPSRDGLFRPAFTDYQFEALAVPRNRDLPANRDPGFHDLGLCGPMRTPPPIAACSRRRRFAMSRPGRCSSTMESSGRLSRCCTFMWSAKPTRQNGIRNCRMERSIATTICPCNIAAMSMWSTLPMIASRARRRR
jgi:cytochrome c peroxidase